jgi:hypothetical protein
VQALKESEKEGDEANMAIDTGQVAKRRKLNEGI